MKILKANAGALSNFELFEFLQSRGAGKDPKRVIARPVAPSEDKVYDYLKQSAASRQTRESISEFVEKSKKYNLAKAETLNIINIAPSSLVEIDPIVEDAENRMGESAEELAELVSQVFPPPPEVESDAKTQENTDVPDGQQIEWPANLEVMKDVPAWPGRHLLEGGEHRRYFALKTIHRGIVEFECRNQRE